MKALRESDIERRLVERVKELGGEVRKVKWIGRRGAPDRLVMLPGFRPALREAVVCAAKMPEALPWLAEVQKNGRSGATVWVEVKRPGKLATFPADAHERRQNREHKRMRKMGQRVVVIDSIEGIEELLS